MDSIDLQIAEFEKRPLYPYVSVDPRVERFWSVDQYWVSPGSQTGPYNYSPVKNGLDSVYGRYTLGINGQGLTTGDYWVIDSENPFYEATLEKFLEDDEKGNIPVEMTHGQKIRYRLATIGLSVSAVLILAFMIILLHHFMVHSIFVHSVPDGSFVPP